MYVLSVHRCRREQLEEKERRKLEEQQKQAQEQAEAALISTPWLWAPKELSESNEPPPSEGPNTRNGHGVQDQQQTYQPPKSHHASTKQVQSASAIPSSHMQEQQRIAAQQRQGQTQAPPHRTQSQNIHPSSNAESSDRLRHPRVESLNESSSFHPSSAPATVSTFSQYGPQQRQHQSHHSHHQQSLQQDSQPQSTARASERTAYSSTTSMQQQPHAYRTETYASTSAQPASSTVPQAPRTPTHISTASTASAQQHHTPRTETYPSTTSSQHPSASSSVVQPPRTPAHVSTASGQLNQGLTGATSAPRTPAPASTASAQTSTEGARGDPFSSHQRLRPTFSSNIIRTPGHYSKSGTSTPNPSEGSPLSRRPTRESSRDAAGSGSIRANVSTPMDDAQRRRIASRSRSRAPSRDVDTESDSDSDDSSPPGPHRRGPIYGPATPTPGHRTDSGHSAASPYPNSISSRDSSIPSLASSMSRMSTADSPATSISSSVFLSTFSDEPMGLLSPLVVGGDVPSKPNTRDLGRSHTYPLIASRSQSPPSNIPAIPEERSPPQISRTPSSKTPKRSPSAHVKTPGSVGRSRTYPTLGADPFSDGEPPVIPAPPSPRSLARAPSPVRHPIRNSSLSQPPKIIPYSSASSTAMSQDTHRRRTQSQYDPGAVESLRQSLATAIPSATPRPQQQTTSTSSSASAYQHVQSQSQAQAQQPTSSPQPPKRKVRYGYWNRRGDHLVVIPSSTPSHSPGSPTSAAHARQYIVYAPHAEANPEELAHYPSPTEGWMNHRGQTLRYDPTVTELPESLPARGEPPVRPYHHVRSRRFSNVFSNIDGPLQFIHYV
jgi:hypothetical protein